MRSTRKSSITSVYVDSSIFCDRRFSFSEALVMHLKDYGLEYCEIAGLLNRDDRTVWTIYHRALKKAEKEKRNIIIKREILIPTNVFKDRSLSIMEVLVEYLKDKKVYTYHEIASMLNRDDRTIWTIYSRTKQKRGIVNHFNIRN